MSDDVYSAAFVRECEEGNMVDVLRIARTADGDRAKNASQ